MAVLLGLAWAIGLVTIPIVITPLVDLTAVPKSLEIDYFLIVTAVGFYAHSIVDYAGKLFGEFQGRGEAKVDKGKIKRRLVIILLCCAGILMVCLWFHAANGRTYTLGGTVYNLGIIKENWLIAVLFLPIIGVLHAWEHPYYRDPSGTAIP